MTFFQFRLMLVVQGADIDIRVVRDGRGPDCNVWSNFKQVNYALHYGCFYYLKHCVHRICPNKMETIKFVMVNYMSELYLCL